MSVSRIEIVMPINLYSTISASPPTRAVETIIKILKLDVNIRYLDPFTKENHEPWFEKINPARQLPVLDDNGYVLADSHAIIVYLLTVYAPKEVLEKYYPTDPKQRGIIDSMLYFESETLFARMKIIMLPLLVTRINEHLPLEQTQYLAEGVDHLERILEGKKWLAGNQFTVADICTVVTMDLIEFLIPLKYYKNISAWASRVRKVCPFYDELGKARLNNYAVIFKKTDYDAEARWNQIQSSVKK